VPTAVAASIRGWKGGEECWNSDLDGQMEAVVASIHAEVVAATSEATQLQETLPTVSQVVGPHENPVT
jgi:hypothetical protein